jgi:expansin (peptidoglycan-binding protein)
MLSTETLEEARLPYCRPNATETASSSASATAAPVHQSASADYEAQSAYAEAVTSESAAEASSTWTPEASTSTWSAKAEATTKAASNPSGDVKTGGFATYFTQNGNAGACGQYHSDSEFGIAIDSNGYWGNDFSQGSDLCGKVINIKNTNNGKTVTATVWDVCPTCNNGNSLDLSVGAFNAIATESEGMVPISWSFA